MNVKSIALIVAGALTVAACSTTNSEKPSQLAVIDEGQVVVMDSDGSARTQITDEEGAFYFQPIWSPDGTQLAYATIGSSPSINLAAPDGTATFSIPTDTFPFYFFWSQQDDLALLRNGDSGLRLDIASATEGELSALRQIDAGQPLYFSWNPGGDKLVAHIGADRLDVNDTDTANALGPEPGAFQSPWWTERGIVAIERSSSDQALVLIGEGGASTPLATVVGPSTLVATTDGTRVAVQSIREEVNGISAVFQAIPTLPSNRVVVIDTVNGDNTSASEGPALAFFWSPGGERLLILDIVSGPMARWSVWSSDRGSVELVRFEPDPSFLRDMVPFFDQYAQSMSLWAPDGSAFAFPGMIDGSAGIWVQEIAGDLTRVSGGNWVSWSP